MSAFERGQWVYVHPDEEDAPRELRGLGGMITTVTGTRAIVAFRRSEHVEPLEVEASILRPERRRRDRPPAEWPQAVA